MGTDIHAAIEYRESSEHPWIALTHLNKYFGRWEGEPELTARIQIDRDYDLFAILANVRNGRGFAGVVTGDGFNFIAPPRGLPVDITPEAAEFGCTGDHSGSWLSLADILDFDWEQTATLRGVVDAPNFEYFDRMREWNYAPREWSGDVSGGSVKKVSNEEMRDAIKNIARSSAADNLQIASLLKREFPNLYTSVCWTKSYARCAEQMWTAILPPMLKLMRHGLGNVRLVMNFDS